MEVEGAAEDADIDIVPARMDHLRACLSCSLVKTFDQFYEQGCENCEQWLEIAENGDNVTAFTSSDFKGMAAVMDPKGRDHHGSWVGSWLRLDGLKPGVYALSVTGSLPDDIVDKLKSAGVYVNRDRSTVATTS